MVTPPHYFHYTATELVGHYTTVAAAAPVPVVIYNAPRYTGNLLTAPVITELSTVDNIVGLKDSSGDDAIVTAALGASFARPAFAVSQGNERRLASALREGAVGITPGLANLAPVPCVALHEAVVRGDLNTAEECQADLDAVGTMHSVRPGVACMKAALSLVGLCPPAPAAPMTAYTSSELDRLRALLAATGARLI